MQSEVNQKEKSKFYCIYIEIRKMVLMNLFAGKEWRHRCREWVFGHSRGRRGWNECESNIIIHYHV